MDTSGFFNAGSWLIREGERGFGVMRGYFQIVRNWKLPVNICDFLNKEFSLNIQTIDWGHPNMRDQTEIYAWAREHQVKFFPEEYTIFTPKIQHKKEMFLELITHNKKIKFNKKEIFSISPINNCQIKPYHPEENSIKLPPELKGIHFDSSWQIALKLGCRVISEQFNSAENKEILYLTGKDIIGDYNSELKKINQIRLEKSKKVELSRIKIEEDILIKEKENARTNPEKKLYKPICDYLSDYFSKTRNEKIVFYDTSSYYLNKFISHNNINEEFGYYQEYKIKPDLVGFVVKDKRILIAEIKATPLSLKDLGQLRGYCLVANPDYAILISDKELSLNLKKIINLKKDILEYAGKKMNIGIWENNKMRLVEI